ncbi:hypothetical protein DEAC_c14130 [Desulfosporosinus acididurans]|uniref:Uncharacterized protein n=1 Tax=Desulfosporosinus acididurans TaxID=476652 RepID=A0A0J1FTE1_9FIRM|nr:hypothetical protein [Desulfosporosinus acididurans]KLU66745.1 hypothetical protein DEAC_c14130 [Desulfosporosinus acididurans]
MDKLELLQRERAKLIEIFKDVEPGKAQLVSGLIDDAAFLYAENRELRELMAETGMIKIHPQFRDRQKQTEAAKQFLKNVNSYAVIIKTLNGVLSKNVLEPDDGLDEFE